MQYILALLLTLVPLPHDYQYQPEPVQGRPQWTIPELTDGRPRWVDTLDPNWDHRPWPTVEEWPEQGDVIAMRRPRIFLRLISWLFPIM